MKLQNIILTTCLAASTLFIQSPLIAQTDTPPSNTAPGAPPKFAPEGKHRGEGRHGKRDPEKRIVHMKETLALTPEQEAKIRDIFKAEGEKMRDERKAGKEAKPEDKERREKMSEGRERVDAAIKAVLTPEQQAKWEATKKDRKDRGPKGEPEADMQAP